MKKSGFDIFLYILTTLVFAFVFFFGFYNKNFYIAENSAFSSAFNIISTIALFGLILVFFIELISPFVFEKSSRFMIFVSLSLLSMFLTSKDFLYLCNSLGAQIELDSRFTILSCKIINYLSFFIMLFVVFRLFKRQYGLVFVSNKRYFFIFIYFALLASVIVLTFFDLSFIPMTFMALFVLYGLFDIINTMKNHDKYNARFVFICGIVISSLGIIYSESFSQTRYVNFNNIGFGPIMYFFIFSLYLAIYFAYVVNTSNSAYKQMEYEKKVKELQISVLKNQMEPHFIFNSLNVIKAFYQEDVDKGNKALDLFSDNLRAITESGDSFVVPLNKELELVSSYIEFVNMKVSNPFNILFDIDATDFSVPYFSIQPLVENAIKYSKVNEKEDGYIEISTYEDNDYYYVKVTDNGVGFDINNISNESHGLKNIKERCSLHLNATLELSSIINEGTKVLIKIPKIRKE